ncbi:MAG TPA: 30S ribosomal protein S6 [Clostridiales bacterium]|nr:30S ribosomal protein S6 [Clostridiales bacterium]
MRRETGLKYELVYIIDPDVDEEARKALIERFGAMIESNGGTVEKTDEWGKRHLAYPINDKTEGYYVLVNFTAETSVPREIERNLGITESIMKYMVIRVDEKRSVVKPRAQRVAAQESASAAPATEAPAEPAQDE